MKTYDRVKDAWGKVAAGERDLFIAIKEEFSPNNRQQLSDKMVKIPIPSIPLIDVLKMN